MASRENGFPVLKKNAGGGSLCTLDGLRRIEGLHVGAVYAPSDDEKTPDGSRFNKEI
jgi:hypothetical protein